MSIYIKGNEFYKPTACAPCKLRQWCQLWKQVTLPAHITHPDCPIVEVGAHGGLIDVDELRKEMYYEAFEKDTDEQRWDSGCWIRYKMFERNVENAPVVIPEDI